MMKHLVISLCLVVFCSTASRSDSLPPTTVDRIRDLTLDGLTHAYNLDIEGANELFDKASAIEPLHPRPYVSKANILFWKILIGKKESDRDSFFTLADQIIETAEKFEDRYGKDADEQQCLGIIYAYRSFIEGRMKSYLKAAWDGKKSYDYFYDALQSDPHLYDAYLGIGLFHYFVSFIPKPLQWVVSVMGISADNNAGLKEIRVAAQRGVYAKVEAQYFLAQFLPWQFGDFDSSEKIFSDLHNEYPKNSIITFTLSIWEIRKNAVRSAREHLLSIVNSTDEMASTLHPFIDYKLGECSFRLSQFEEARRHYQEFLREYKDQAYVATANYRIGYCFEFGGQRDSALVYYKRAANSDHKFGDDGYAGRKASQRMTSPLHPVDTLFMSAQNNLRSGSYDRAIVSFHKVIDIANPSSDEYTESLYGLGETLFENGQYALAIEQFKLVSNASVNRETWLRPWACYEAGLSYNKIGDKAAAEKEFHDVLSYENYDFENWYRFRAERETELLKNQK